MTQSPPTARLQSRFEQLRDSKQSPPRAALVTFITAGDPDLATSAAILRGLPEAGADIIELGMPFSDPMADGPAIQLASARALNAGTTLRGVLKMVREFRQHDAHTPIVLMGYYNPIYRFGNQRFIDAALDAGVDGVIIVDLPPEEDDELCHPCRTAGLHWIRLTTPTTDAARLEKILRYASGFVYHVSIAGITGTRSADQSTVQTALAQIRRQTDLPIAVGFGIKTAAQVADAAKCADAVVVGSAIVAQIETALEQNCALEQKHALEKSQRDIIVNQVHRFVAELAGGVRNS